MTDTNSLSRPLIAHIIFRLDTGGLENGLINLINHMPDRYRHAIICLKDYTSFRDGLTNPNVEVIALNKRDGKDLGNYVKLWRVLRRLKPDIVHTRNLTALDCLVPAALAGVRARVHGEHGWDMFDLHGTSLKYKLLRKLCKPLVSRYVALSKELEQWLLADIGVRRERLVRIVNGVDTDKFVAAKIRESISDDNDFPADAVVVGYVGRMRTVKDPMNLARAFIQLANALPDSRQRLRLVMVGDGPEKSQVEAELTRAGLADLTWFPGNRGDIAKILRGLDVFVLPSLKEGISNTILEAMAAGLPVVATNVGGNPDIVDHGRSGTLVPPEDSNALAQAIESYVDDPQLRRAHGSAGRVLAENEFSLNSMVRSYVSVYDQLLA